MKKLNNLLVLSLYMLLAAMPRRLKIFIYNRVLKCEIHPSARIGFSFIKAHKIIMGPNATIKNFCYIKNLELLEMGPNASIGCFNKATAMSLNDKRNFKDEKDRFPALRLGTFAAIVNGHAFDCNNTINIGDYTILAGSGSAIYTHSINIENNRQESAPVTLGKYCMIAARCVIVKGVVLPDFCVLGASSMLHKSYIESHTLYSGVPAIPIKKFPDESLYFKRVQGYVP